ncbi:MAG: hypothetical protein HYY18_15125 [Planctomycetes bacterium]|nr:hypothetical protein [Planctomycetota bacterium]
MRLLASLTAFLVIASSAAAGDCAACKPDNMCLKHEKEQEAVLEAFRKRGKIKDPLERKAALEKVGQFNDSHLNCRSKDVAEVVAPFLEDTDSGIRLYALELLKTNQERVTAIAAIRKVLAKLCGKVGKSKPKDGKLMAEWDNALNFAKEVVTALAAIGGEEVVPDLILAIESANVALSTHAAAAAVSIRDKRFADAYLDRLTKVGKPKDPDQDYLFKTLAGSFRALTSMTEEPGDDPTGWLGKARKHWKVLEPDWK